MTTTLQFLWENAAAARRFRTGVSLHSHTMHSHEDMSCVPKYVHGVPLLSYAVRRQERRYRKRSGRELDYRRVYWTPPLTARQAFDLERSQIEHRLELNGLVSLSDHDEIEACLQLQVVQNASQIPLSIEWTVPLGPSFVHVGVHNLPPALARGLVAEMKAYTQQPESGRLRNVLASLSACREVLVVLNHPMWDEHRIGAAAHFALVRTFLRDHGTCVHALELNGLRSWSENRSVCALAQATGRPLISGGDRHGCEPNANVNLTHAGSFAEFVEEIRSGASHVLFLPQYRENIRLRYLETMWDVIRDYPDHTNRVRWSDRVFYRRDNGVAVPLSTLWQSGGPDIVRCFLTAVRFFQSPGVRSVLRLALSGRQEFAQ